MEIRIFVCSTMHRLESTMNCETYHIPVMLQECMDGLNIHPDGVYVDMTYGGGGHSREILKYLTGHGHLYGFDQDADAMAGAVEDEHFTFVRSNFRFLRNWMQYYGITGVDGILADLGVSSHHLDAGERGFSFRYDAPLDMRMNQRGRFTAHDLVMEYPEERLADVLYLYGELKQSRRLASAIVKKRAQADIKSTGELSNIVSPLLGRDREKKDLARVFQALRIEVNGEMNALRQMLDSAIELLNPGGRLVVMTYHSLEDRMVKNAIRGSQEETTADMIYGGRKTLLRQVNRNVITASDEELAVNPRSRSAKLRIAEKR